MRATAIGTLVAILGTAGTASAAPLGTWDITTGASTSVAGALTDSFDPGAQINLNWTGGALYDTSIAGVTAQPPGSTGNWWSIGTSPAAQAGPGFVTLTTPATYYGFLWGSPDAYNTVTFFDGSTMLASFTGNQVFPGADGYQGPIAGGQFFNFFVDPGYEITSVEFQSSANAFETDNHAVLEAVPEPGMLSLVGAGLLAGGLFLRRRRT